MDNNKDWQGRSDRQQQSNETNAAIAFILLAGWIVGIVILQIIRNWL